MNVSTNKQPLVGFSIYRVIDRIYSMHTVKYGI